MIPPIPPTPTQTGAPPPPLGAPPMAPPMGAPMPPSPMGKGLGSMLNTDPMARSDFSMMLSDIQNQAMIPPMPMHMNEGGLVGFIQNLLKGIGGLFRGGGGQQGGSGSLKDFERAFATARAKGLKTFPFDRNGDGVDEIYTTRYENEPIEGEEQKKDEVTQDVENAVKKYGGGVEEQLETETAPTSAMRKRDSVADLLIQAQQSQTRGLDPKVPEGGRPRTESEDIARNFANRLEQIKKEMDIGSDQFALDQQREQEQKLLNQIRNRQREQTRDLSAIFEADQSEAPDVKTIPYDEDSLLETYSKLNASANRADQNVGSISNFDQFEEGNAVDTIQDQLEKLINVSGDQLNLPEGLTEGVKPMGLDEKIESLYQSGLKNIGNVKEEVSDLTSRIKKLLGMNQGGNPMVEQLKAMIAESSNPQEKLQEMFSTFKEAEANDEDVSQLLEAIAIIQQSPEFMKEATRSSLLGTMPPQPKERVSDNVMGRKFGLQKDFYDQLKNLLMKNPFMDAQIRLNIKDPPEGMSPIEAAMGVAGAPRYAFTPEVKELLGLSNGGSVTDAIARLEKGGEPEDQKFKQMLQNLIGGDIFDLEQGDKEFAASMGLTGAAMPVLSSLIRPGGRLNKMAFDPDVDFRGRDLEEKIRKKYMKTAFKGQKPYGKLSKPTMSFSDFYKTLKPEEISLDKKKIILDVLKRGLGKLLTGGAYLSGFSPKMMADSSFPESMIVNKNQGGAINASNLGMMQGMGMSSGDNIQRLLYPLVNQIHRSHMQENDSDIKKKLDEFTQQVDQLTKSTFPDVSFQNQNTGFGSMPLVGPGGVPTGTRQFGVYNPNMQNASQLNDPNASSNPFQNFVTTSDLKPNDINSFASSPFGKSLGSFFQDKFQSLQGYNTGGIVNPDRINEIMAVMNKYSVNGVVDGNNPDYKAEVKAIIDKYENMEAQGGDSQQLPPFLPGQQGDSPFAGTNLPSENLVNETATEVEDEEEPVQVFSNIGRQGQGQGYQTIKDVIKDLGGGTGTVERLYFQDPETGRVFEYDYDDSEFKGLGPGYYGKSLQDGDLQLVSGISKNRNNENVSFQVDDPSKYDVSGILSFNPETREAMRLEQAKDDKSDNDLFYTAPNGQTYVDVSGTGESIPVGSTDIRRIGAVDTPSLEKTYDGYQAMGTSTQQELLDTVPKSGSFLDAFKLQEMGGKPFDLGELLGMKSGQLVFSNPPSNQTNLESFFNNVQDVGGIENFLRSSQDKLGLLKDYGFTDLLVGNLPSKFLTMDGKLDEANINNTLNEYLSGTTSSGDPSTTFGDSFNQISNVNTTNDGSDGSSGGDNGGDGGGGSSDDDDNGEPSKTLFNFKDLYTNTEPMEDIIARTVVDSPVSSEGMGTFSPIDSSVVYDPDMFTDFSFPDPSDMTIRDNENPFEDDNRGNVDPSIPPIVTPDPIVNPDPILPNPIPDPTPTPDEPTPTPDEPTPTPTPQPTDYSYLSNYNTLKEGGGAPDLALQTYERTGTVIPGYHGLISEYSGKPISELETFKVPDGYVPGTTNTANMNMGGMSSNGDVISKFLAMDIDKRPLSKTPKVEDITTLTASVKMNEGGEVTAGMNKAIDTFLASMM